MDGDLVHALIVRGLDAVTAYDEGMVERADEAHLDYATRQGRVLYSFNRRDFYRLHIEYLKQGRSHAGIILAQQQRYSVGEQMRRILKLNAAKSAADMKNAVEFLSAWG